MGGGQAKPAYTGPRKKVVIIGASFGGDKVAKGLIGIDKQGTALEILLVDKSEHFENNCGNFKMFVDDCFKEHSIKFEKQIGHYDSTSIQFKHGRLTNIKESENEIEIEKPDGSTESVPYDVLVIATGGAYTAPWRADADKLASLEDRAKECEEFRKQVLDEQKILCFGSGPTAIEVAGYTKDRYPDKTVALAHRGETLLPDLPDCHEPAKRMLEAIGVEVMHNTPFDEEKLRESWPVIINCRGYQYLGPQLYLKDNLAQCIDKKSGQILVNEYCQMTNVHPLIESVKPELPTVFENIFSVGDICLTKMNEVKSIVSMMQYLHVPVQNIFNKAIGEPVVAKLPEAVNLLMMIPIGKKHGIFKFNKMLKEDPTIFDQKDGINMLEMGARNNDKKSLEEQQKQGKKFGGFLNMAQGNCYCLPMHINKQMPEFEKRKAEFKKKY